MSGTAPLIRTKLRLPFIRPGLVPRPRLQAQIEAGVRYPLTLVIASAGFGKTTLVAASIAACQLPVAWLSLDRGDNQEGRFLTYLIAAIQGADSRIGSEAAHLMTEVRQPTPEAVLTSLINDLDSAGGELLLVLDDYQFISSPAVHAEVVFLLAHCPPTFHLLIATRSDPPLPLARLRARGQLVELRTADLRFTAAEAAQFLNGGMGLDLDSGSVAVLEERTEGWVAGLQMAALSMRDHEHIRKFIEGFSGTNRHILDYLLEEVLAGQPEEVQRFLLYTSVLERLTAPLCDTVLESRPKVPAEEPGIESSNNSLLSTLDSRSVLEYLERENLFLVPLDDERVWYRYHHLFADLLAARLHQAQPDWIPSLHIRASTWLEQNGLISEAIQHFFAANEAGQAADLIERYGPARLAEGDPSVLQMADSLPQEVILARPKIGLYQAWFLIIHGRIGKALPLLNDLARQEVGTQPNTRQGWMQTVAVSALAFLKPPGTSGFDPLPDYGLLEEIPSEELLLRNAADFLYGMALARQGEIDRAEEIAVKSIQREKRTQRTLAIPTMAPLLTRISLMQGRLTAVASLCREFLDPIKEGSIKVIYAAGSMEIDLGEVLYERNCLEEAEQHIRNGLEANEPWQNIMTDAFGLSALTRVLRAKEDYAGALQTVEGLETVLLEHSQPREFDEDFHTLRARLQLAGGDLQSVSQWAEQIQLSEDFRLHEERYRLILARIRLAQGRYAEVEKLLAGGIAPFAAGSRITRQLEFRLLLGAAIAGQQRWPEAMQIVESCLALAEPEGYIRIFLDVGEPARELLTAYGSNPASAYKNYAQTILDAFGPPTKPEPPGFQKVGLVEMLTPRELDVLRLLAQGCSNRQIAEKLVLSEGTVKFYLHAIMEKLGVHSRTQAVLIARERNLV